MKYSTFINMFQVINLSQIQDQFVKIVDAVQPQSQTNISRDVQQYTLKDLIPGATYHLQLLTIFNNKESVVYISKNFTTSQYTCIY